MTTSEFDDVKARLARIENKRRLTDSKGGKKPSLRRASTGTDDQRAGRRHQLHRQADAAPPRRPELSSAAGDSRVPAGVTRPSGRIPEQKLSHVGTICSNNPTSWAWLRASPNGLGWRRWQRDESDAGKKSESP